MYSAIKEFKIWARKFLRQYHDINEIHRTVSELRLIAADEYFLYNKHQNDRAIERVNRVLYSTIKYYLKECNSCKSSISLIDQSKYSACTACKNCMKCCKCINCNLCQLTQVSICVYCKTCQYCCACVLCHMCNAECTNNSCLMCLKCEQCCSCQNRIHLFSNPIKFHKDSGLCKENISTRFIAAELEIAALHKHGAPVVEAVSKWSGSIVRDGSLPDGGFEINTAPASGNLFINQIKEICYALNSAEADITGKCGLHVHIDARDFNYYDILKLIKVYSTIEDALFCMVPHIRKNSRYAINCKKKYSDIVDFYNASLQNKKFDYKELKNTIIKATYNTKNTRYNKTEKYIDARYNALNIHSWFYRKTIECRLFNGTTSSDKIIDWATLWALIVDFAHNKSFTEISKLNSNPINNLMHIAGNNQKLISFIQDRLARFSNA